jgi:hypothetical protein
VAAVLKYVPGPHSADCVDGHAVDGVVSRVEGVAVAEKVPASQGVHLRSPVVDAGSL